MATTIPINKFTDPDRTIDEVLEMVEFQNSMGNVLTSHATNADTVDLIFETATGDTGTDTGAGS